jgi:hypothetical protein
MDGATTAWAWRRPLWVWEEVFLGECRTLLSDLALQPNVADQWLWRHDPDGGVFSAYSSSTSCCGGDINFNLA